MKTLFYLLPLCTLLQPVVTPDANPADKPVAEKNFFRFGDQLVSLETQGSPASRNYVLLGLHGHEIASLETMEELSRITNAYYMRIRNEDRRMIEGNFLDRKIAFDPHHIYTSWGRKEHLKANGCWTKYVDLKVEQFANFIINEIPYNKAIVSLHSNHGHSIKNYIENKKLNKQVKEVYKGKKDLATDFFITTDDQLFSALKEKGNNVVLLHPKKTVNDGNFAVYCMRNKIPYVQVETTDPRSEHAARMLETIDGILK